MPPYSANKSKSQQRLMFAKAKRGEVSKADAVGRARASKGKDLPERVEKAASSGDTVKHDAGIGATIGAIGGAIGGYGLGAFFSHIGSAFHSHLPRPTRMFRGEKQIHVFNGGWRPASKASRPSAALTRRLRTEHSIGTAVLTLGGAAAGATAGATAGAVGGAGVGAVRSALSPEKHASLAAILLKLAESGDDSGDGDDQDASPEDDWVDEKPKEKVSFVLAAALSKLADDMIDDVAPPSAIEGKQKPLNPPGKQPIKGLDSDKDIATEKKMHTEPLKGAQPLPKNFQWPSGKKSAS